MMEYSLERMWINQPSELQQSHKLHGSRVLAELTGEESVTIYFLEGKVISQTIFVTALSHGWGDSGNRRE